MKKILFCGGGSAGHVIPNIALIEELRENYECIYAGTNGIEKTICAENGVEFYEFSAVKLKRGKFFANLALPFRLFKAVGQAQKILEETKPDLVFCKGGYACYPPARAAKKAEIPVITHESDVNAGLANKLIAKNCKKVLTSFPTAAKQLHGICTGSPVRARVFNADKLAARGAFGLDMRPTVVVLGGGSGSEIINKNLREIIVPLCRDFNVLHVCGRGKAVESNVYGYKQIEFTENMGEVYACASLAVSRCGSNTAFELTALKIPALYIPLENRASRGDQVKNAQYFESAGLCKVLREKQLTPQKLLTSINELYADQKIKTALSRSGIKCGNENIIREIVNTLNASY